MVQTQISDWLGDPGRNYQLGLQLYSGVRHNRNILSLLSRKESKSNMEKLIYELGKFSDVKIQHAIPRRHVEEISVSPKIAFQNLMQDLEAKEVEKEKLMFHDLPSELRPVLLEKNRSFFENCYLKVELNELPEDAIDEAFALQVKIDANWKTNALCWKKLDHWIEHRTVIESKPNKFESMTGGQLAKRQQQLFSSVSKLKKRIAGYEKQTAEETNVGLLSKAKRALVKSASNLITQEDELNSITNLIEGHGK